MPAVTQSPAARVVAASLALGAVSLLVPSALGYDPWAWMVWGRELLHLTLSTTDGPSWKPLPALVAAPLALLGRAQPYAWLVVARAGAFVAVIVSFRLATRVAGVVAGAAAALALVLSADFFVTALRGYSEPWLIAFALAAVLCHLDRRWIAALGLVALASLLRPEAWFFLLGYGAWVWWTAPATRWTATALVAAPFVIWLGLDWIGSGSPTGSSTIAQEAAPGTAAATAHPALTVLQRAVDASTPVVLALAALGAWLAWRRRDRVVLALAAIAVAWTAIVAIMAQAGYTGSRRYLLVSVALAGVVAGAGVAWVAQRRVVLVVAAAVVLLASGFSHARTDGRLVGLAREQIDQLRELRVAVRRAGGRGVVRRAAINPALQTPLAWELQRRLGAVQPTWTRRDWTGPAFVFRAPPRLAGPAPAIAGRHARPVARAGRWRVLYAPALGAQTS